MKLIKSLFIFGLTFLVTLFTAELFIRNAHITSLSMAEFYPDIGKGLPKSKEFVLFNEGFAIVKTNDSRFYGNNVSRNKPKNTLRIALLGDSYIQATQVFERHHFGNIAKEILAKKFPNKQIEILNFGRENFNFGNMYAYQKVLVDQFKPDHVLYFLSQDDLEIDYKNAPLLPKTIFENNRLKTTLDYKNWELSQYNKTKILTQNSSFFSIINNGRHKVKEGKTLSILLDKFYAFPKQFPIQNKKTLTLNSTTEKIVSQLDKNVIIINRELEKMPAIFEVTCKNNNVIYWDLQPVLKSMKLAGNHPLYWKISNEKGHWNHNAHQKIGEIIAHRICELGVSQ